MNERSADLPALATDDLYGHAIRNGGDLDKAWVASFWCGPHHEPKKDLMFARVGRWLKERAERAHA